jgi:hypothetical protein
MKSGKCPKCNQQNVYVHHGTEMLTFSGLLRYACNDCHFSEVYLPDRENVPLDRDSQWKRVSAPASGPFR